MQEKNRKKRVEFILSSKRNMYRLDAGKKITFKKKRKEKRRYGNDEKRNK